MSIILITRAIAGLVALMIAGTGASDAGLMGDDNAVMTPESHIISGQLNPVGQNVPNSNQQISDRGGIYTIPLLSTLTRWFKNEDVEIVLYVNNEIIGDTFVFSKSKDYEIWYLIKSNYPIHITDMEIEIEGAEHFIGTLFLKGLNSMSYTIENVTVDDTTMDITIKNPYRIEVEDDFNIIDESSSFIIEAKDIPTNIKPIIIEDTYYGVIKINYYRINNPTQKKHIEKEFKLKIEK